MMSRLISKIHRMEADPDITGWVAELELASSRLDIKENLSLRDAGALAELVQLVMREGIMIAEVGSWKGYSTAVLAKSGGEVFAIDHWKGNEGTWQKKVTQSKDIYQVFKRNMLSLGIWDRVHPLVMDSLTASKIFADGLLDLVFLDADHRYEPFKKDLEAWFPKVKAGGILCGHDCEGYYSQFPEGTRELIDEHLEDDYVSGIHPGVVKALDEFFLGNYLIMPNSIVWYYVKR